MKKNEFESIKEDCLKNDIHVFGNEYEFYIQTLNNLGCLVKGLNKGEE